MTLRLSSLFVALALAGSAAQSAAPAIETIRLEDLRADLFFLGSDALKGRLTNTQENLVAGEWIKSRFERLGLEPVVPGYFHKYNLMTVTLGEKNGLEIVENRAALPVAHGEGYSVQRFSATGEARGGVAFAGYGITAADMSYDDYRNASAIKGRFVLVIDHEPGERDPASPFDGVVTSDNGGPLRKALAAQAKGAIGILYVSDVHNHNGAATTVNANAWRAQPSRLGTYSLESWMTAVKIPAVQISTELAGRIVKGAKRTLDELSKASDTPNGISAVALPGIELHLTTSVNRTAIPDRNVLAKLEGSDPKLRDEWIVISAHFDHDGANGDQIFNGADDDGSGTVGLLEIAEAYATAAKSGQRPRRSILFAAWNSEERGLLGAWAYVEQPVIPLNRIVAVLNMDMIGRNEEVPGPAAAAPPAAAAAAGAPPAGGAPGAGGRQGGGGRFNGLEPQDAASNNNALNIIGAVRSPDLRAAVDRANVSVGLDVRYRYDNNVSQLMRRSDHWPFIQRGIPGIWIFTGLHPDYHTVNDDPERINYEKMTKILKLTYQMSWDLAQAAGKPALLRRR